MSILLTLVVVIAFALPIAASDRGFWTDREVCRAAIKTYFFLDAKPADAPVSGEFAEFRSASGNLYGCRIRRARAELRWVSASGETMTSNSTMFHVLDNELTIQTDTKTQRFAAK